MLTGIYIFKDWRVSLIFLSLILGVLNLSLILIIAEEIDS